MRELKEILNKNYRVIEFSTKKSFVTKQFNKRDNFLTVVKNKNMERDGTIFLDGKHFTNAIVKNSTDVIILNNTGWNELKALQKTVEAIFIFERIKLYNIIFLTYFLLKEIITRHKKFYGLFYLRKGINISLYLGLQSRKRRKGITRHYLSPLISLEDFFQELNKKNITYCILRWFETLPKIEPGEDVDIMVEDNDLTKVYSIIDQKPGIVPFDVYSKSGMPGSDFKSLPYYVFSLAEAVLSNTILYKNAFKVPTWENYFYLLAYHAVFHKGETSGLSSNKYSLTSKVKPDHDYLFHIKMILSKTNLDVEDLTLEGLHSYLEDKNLAPPLDTQYKLSLYNQYLKAYLEDYHIQSDILKKFEGLVCFVAREKIVEAGLLEHLKKFIQKQGFTTILTTKIEDSLKDGFTKRVRGGNWNQGPWPANGGAPSVLLVAFDVNPIKPNQKDQQQHPGLTNKRIQDKNEIRDFLNKQFPDKKNWCNGLHSSDNEIQAVEYLSLAGLDKELIFEELKKHKEKYETKYPVIEILSRYSRRAKVELISYKGKRAIKKTFKPRCEWFLANEIEAYTVFKDLKEIPQLLETGENYFITSYIEESKPFNSKINIRTFKKCLNSLRRIYDRGYSLLDFQPANFLVDKKKNIYLTDFEFLHKYTDKPPFLECYDLIGVPEHFDLLYTPIIKIPKGMKQFDAKWCSYTGIRYDELSKLNKPTIYFNSLFCFYNLKVKELIRLIINKSKQGIRVLYRALP